MTKASVTERRYLLLAVAVGFIFFYLLFTEVYDRCSNTWALYESLQEKQATILDPAILSHRKRVLTAERDSLSSKILSDRSAYQQSEIGVIQCVSTNARKNQVVVESFVPGDDHAFPLAPSWKGQEGQFQEFDFAVLFKAKFSEVGMFMNGIENETIPIDITRVQIVSDPIGNGNLKVNIQAKAYLYHGIH